MSNLARFLDELDSQLRKSLPREEAEAVVWEARVHLEDSIQARLELGATAEAAEREALISFGSAASVNEETRRREPLVDRDFLGISIAVVAFWVGAYFSSPLSDGMKDLMMLCFIGLHVFYVAYAAKTRRFQTRALGAVLGMAWAVWALKGAMGYSMVPEGAFDSRGLDFVREAIDTVRLGGWIFAAVYVGLYAAGWSGGQAVRRLRFRGGTRAR